MSVFGPLAPEPAPPTKGPPPITGLLALGLFGAVLGSFVSNLDTRLTVFSLADLRGGTGFGLDEASWVTAAYSIAEVAVVPLTPWLAAIISPRRSIVLATVLLTLAGGFVPMVAADFPILVTLRFLQGMGGGALIPLLLLSVLRFTPPHQRVFGLTVYGFLTLATPLFAEGIAGLLTEHIGWQAIFYISIPIGPVVVALVLIGLPVEPFKMEIFIKTDYWGMLLLALFAGTFTAALDQGQRLDWFDSGLIDSLFAAAACLLIAFVALELTLEKPLINLRLLTRLNFTGGLLMVFGFGFASLFTSSVLPQFGMEVSGYRELQVGGILVIGGFVQMAVCCVVPFLLRLLEARVVLALGLFGVAIGARLATYIDSDWVLTDVLLALVISTAAQPLLLVPVTIISTSTLKPEDALSGGTIFNVVRNLAVSIAGAVMTAILTVRERVHSAYITEHVVTGAPATLAREASGGGLRALAAAVRVQATTEATADGFGWIGIAMMIAFVLVLVLHPTPIPFPPKRGSAQP